MPEPARHLRVVTIDEAGETHEGCAECSVKNDQIKGLQRDIRGWAARYAELERDKEAEARAHELWQPAMRLFKLYCHLTPRKNGSPRKLTWDAERFEMVRPFLKKHGVELCERAIVGRVFDHFTGTRANGSKIHYHEWERIFGSKGDGATAASNFEESCNRAPADWRDRLPEGVT